MCMRKKILGEALCQWVQEEIQRWEQAGGGEGEFGELVAELFYYIGNLSWSGRKLHEYLEDLGNALICLSKIESRLSEGDEIFLKHVYPALLSACGTALTGIDELLLLKRLELRHEEGAE